MTNALITKEVVSGVLVAALAVGTSKMLDRVPKYKRVNQVVAVGAASVVVNYLRCKNKMPTVEGFSINHKHSKIKE